jgi:Ca-activated chloride channel family protein
MDKRWWSVSARPRGMAALVAVIPAVIFLAACGQKPLEPTRAKQQLERMVQRLRPREVVAAATADTGVPATPSVADTLPDLGKKYPFVVEPRAGGSVVAAEIFSSTEKAGTGMDRCLVEIALAFNERGLRTASGRTAQVAIRSIPSGTAYEYIAFGTHLPDAFTPSNHLWIQMVRAAGVPVEAVSERLVDNTAGIVMKEAVYRELEKRYGTVDVRSIIDAVSQGSLAMGYTNPFASSTGLNFLVTVLATFAKGAEDRMLSPEVVSAFEAFQRGVPFVALTTMQMRDSVEQGGSLDAFVLEHQTFLNTSALKTGWRFIPFGYAHDNPLYAVGAPDAEHREVLSLFAEFVASPAQQRVAERFGFNRSLSFAPLRDLPSGQILAQAQRLWKQKKDLGRPIAAVFLADVSGSMAGLRIRNLKEALRMGSAFIDPRNSIGLVCFATEVTKLLPVRPFAASAKAQFLGAVEEMNASGNTAMYDGILVSLQMLIEEMRRQPDVKPLLFVLTDGETNRGYTFRQVGRVIEGLQIPVYTISYGEDVSELKRLSSLNEAASLKADPDDIAYQIGALLNAEM